MGPLSQLVRVWREPESARPEPGTDESLTAYLCGSRDLHQLVRRLEVAARRRKDQARGLRAVQAALLLILYPDTPQGEAGALPAA